MLIGFFFTICLMEFRLDNAEGKGPRYDLKNLSRESVQEHILTEDGKNKVVFTTGEWIKRKYKTNFFKFGGKSYSDTALCNEAGELISYYSDRYGFNNSDEVWKSDKQKIILLGDSYIHGACQSEGNSVSDLLKKHYKNNNVINLALSGNGPLSNLGIFMEYIGKNNDIRKIIYFHFEGNDLVRDLSSEITRDELKNYLSDKTQNLKSKQKDIDDIMQKYTDQARELGKQKNALKSFFSFIELRAYFSNKIESQISSKETFEKVINKIKNYCNDENCFKFVYIPSGYSFRNPDLYGEDRKYIFKFLEEHNIDNIDMYDIYKNYKHPSENYFYEGSHLSDLGASRLVESLVER